MRGNGTKTVGISALLTPEIEPGDPILSRGALLAFLANRAGLVGFKVKEANLKHLVYIQGAVNHP